MRSLPPALAPWRQALSLFPPETARSLGALVRQLQPLFGPPVRDALSTGEPEGLGDLARRGSYERLLASEWLLADEAPDEFLRRAANAEHVFLAPARRSQGSFDACTVLFDAGPLQLGAPRIAHLALLILLAQRAQDSKLTFSFGVLQQPDELITTDSLTTDAVMRVLDARTATAVDPSAWQTKLEALGSEHELWVVGHPETLEAFPSAASVAVDEVVHPSEESLWLRVRQPLRPPVERTIPVPTAVVGLRLLRRPFDERVTARAPSTPTRQSLVLAKNTPLRMSGDRRRVMARLEDGRLVAFYLHGKQTPGKPKVLHWRDGAELLAATLHGARWGALWREDGEILATGWARENRILRCFDVPTGVAPPLGQLQPGRLWQVNDSFVFIDGHQGVYRTTVKFDGRPDDGRYRIERLGRAMASEPHHPGPCLVYRDDKGRNLSLEKGRSRRIDASGLAGSIVLGRPIQEGGCSVAWSRGEGAWTINPGGNTLTPPSGAKVLCVGETDAPGQQSRYRLLCLTPDRDALIWLDTGGAVDLVWRVVRQERIVNAWASANLDRSVMLTNKNRLLVVDLSEKKLLHDEGVEVAS